MKLEKVNSFIKTGFFSVFYEIFRKLLIPANKISKIYDKKGLEDSTDVKELLEGVAENKKLIFDSVEESKVYSPMHYFLLIVLSTKVSEITELDLTSIPIESSNTAILKVLKEFVFLQKLKLKITSNLAQKKIYSKKLKSVIKNLKHISHFNCTFQSGLTVEINENFTHEFLKKLKLKGCELAINCDISKKKFMSL